ncbi:hypothetical protein ONZ45_g5112 [Pleurotus djamor]|nr:hypothetical protein ONZ45_g5112 [Pleurotus djamor]
MGTPSPVPIISRPSSSPPDTDVYAADAPVFDRFITASPQPVSEPDETTHEEEETRFAYWRDTIASYPFVMDDGDTPTGPGSASRQLTLRPDQIFIPHEAFDPDGEFLDMDPLDPSVLPDSQEKAFEPALFP